LAQTFPVRASLIAAPDTRRAREGKNNGAQSRFVFVDTPPTLRATATAVFWAAGELTNPLSLTTPLNVSTLISADFSVGSLKMAALTLSGTLRRHCAELQAPHQEQDDHD
jgi:hypothetical protein